MAEIPTVLRIGLSCSSSPPLPGSTALNCHTGGPEVLLRWLETQMGLLTEPAGLLERVSDYANILDSASGASFTRSLQADRWATAAELLRRRTDLRLAGWDGIDVPGLPTIVHDVARVEQIRMPRKPDEGDRLCCVLKALDSGQQLPLHRCILQESPGNWPRLWQQVLERMSTEVAPRVSPGAPTGSALAQVQAHLFTGDTPRVCLDSSLRWVRSRSIQAACEAIALAMAAERELLIQTVVCCADGATAICLDRCLAQLGLPTMGASLRTLAHPALQLLPLSLHLCWQPVDPATVLDFLSLSPGPISGQAARKLSEALTKQPGLGSAAWDEVVEELCGEEGPEGKLRTKLQDWLGGERRPWGQPLPSALVAAICRRVAQWSSGRAANLREGEGAAPEVAEALQCAAGQASALAEIVTANGGDLSEAQLARLVETALGSGVSAQAHTCRTGGPRLVTNLADIDAPCARLIWLGLGATSRGGPLWSVAEFRQLMDAGITVDDGVRSLAVLRSAERSGLCRVTGHLLAVSLPSEQELNPHPVWLQISGSLLAEDQPIPPVDLEVALTRGEEGVLTPWRLTVRSRVPEPAQPRRLLWPLPAGLLQERPKSSATELTSRLACPLQWVLKYAAKLYPGPIAHLPADFRLKGEFLHYLLKRVFDNSGPLPEPDEAAQRIARAFDERLPLDAAPLAATTHLAERSQLRREIQNATRTLVGAMRAAGLQLRLEVPVEKELPDGRSLTGFVDCLASRTEDAEAIVDFKYSGSRKYREMLELGRAVQLAVYSWVCGKTGPLLNVGYLILSEGQLFCVQGTPWAGQRNVTEVADRGTAQVVWTRFQTALTGAQGWLTGSDPVPARPLQKEEDHPADAAMVIDTPTREKPVEACSPCQYCDYKVLCGLKELR